LSNEEESFLGLAITAKPEQWAPTVRDHVRYLANTLPTDETIAYLESVTQSPNARREMIVVRRALENLLATPLADVRRLSRNDALLGNVAKAWLQVAYDAVVSTRRLVERTALHEVANFAHGSFDQLVALRCLAQAARTRRGIPPALTRGSEFATEAYVDELGNLHISASARAGEPQMTELFLRGESPILLGVGTLDGGMVRATIPGVGQLFGWATGPIDGSLFTVGLPESSQPQIAPMEDEGLPVQFLLTAPPKLADGFLTLQIQVPADLLSSGLFAVFAGLAPGAWQKIGEIKLEPGRDEYALQIEWDHEDGPIPFGYRYRASL
jgi:hypothetical protein